MRFYVAGKFEDRKAVKWLIDWLKEMGHEITVDWTSHEYEDEGYPVQYSQDDIRGVKECDAYVGIFNANYAYRGALVEMGAALALDKKVYIIGQAINTCMFVSHPLVQKIETELEFLSFVKNYYE